MRPALLAAAAAILALAGFLRAWHLGDAPELHLVEAEALLNLRSLASGGDCPYALHGFFRLTPVASFLFYYLVLPFAWLGDHAPAALRALPAASGVAASAAVAVCYRLLYGEWGRGALVAMALPAVLLGYVAYTRQCDQMPFIPLAAAVQMALWLAWRRHGRAWAIPALGFSIGFAASIHLIFLVTPAALLLVGRWLSPPPAQPAPRPLVLLAALLFVVGFLPMLAANARTNLQTVRYLVYGADRHQSFGPRLARNLGVRAVQAVTFYDGGRALRFFLGDSPRLVLPTMSLVLLASLIALLRAPEERRRTLALLGWMAFGLLVICFSPSQFNLTHNLLFLLPASLLLGRWASRGRPATALATAALAVQVWLCLAYVADYRASGGMPAVRDGEDQGLYYMSGLSEVAARIAARPSVRRVYAQNTMIYFPLRARLPEDVQVRILGDRIGAGQPLPRGSDLAYVLWAVPVPAEATVRPPQPTLFQTRPVPNSGRLSTLTVGQVSDHSRHWVAPALRGSFRSARVDEAPTEVVRGADGRPHFEIYFESNPKDGL